MKAYACIHRYLYVCITIMYLYLSTCICVSLPESRMRLLYQITIQSSIKNYRVQSAPPSLSNKSKLLSVSNFVLTQELEHTQNESSTGRLKLIQYCKSKTIKLSQMASLELPFQTLN